MNTQHTPGPWHVNAISENRIVGDETAPAHSYSKLMISNSNATVAEVYRPRDACVIKAAPDLLAALRELQSAAHAAWNQGWEHDTLARNRLAEQIHAARAAIAKAEGK